MNDSIARMIQRNIDMGEKHKLHADKAMERLNKCKKNKFYREKGWIQDLWESYCKWDVCAERCYKRAEDLKNKYNM